MARYRVGGRNDILRQATIGRLDQAIGAGENQHTPLPQGGLALSFAQ
jgi:hypothetical protein